MPHEFRGTINLKLRDSKEDGTRFLPRRAPQGAPNVLVVLFDDTGQAAWSPYGGRIEMPTLQRLADDGLTYLQWHTTWDELSKEEKALFARMAEVYAAFSEYTDHQVGRIVDYLEESGQVENTLLLYCADNGASGEGSPNGSVNENKFFNGYPDRVEYNLPLLDRIGSPATYNHYPTGWAAAFSAPYRMFKRYTYQGGVCDSMVIHWPAEIKAKGEVRNQYHHCTDVVPTILECCGVEFPATYNGVTQSPLPGVSALWYAEAGKYNVLPLNDYDMGDTMQLNEFFSRQYHVAQPKSGRYTYYPGTTEVPEHSAANTHNRSFKILAEVTTEPDAQGVVFAQGARFGGHTLFLKDGKVHYTYNFLGLEEQVLSADLPQPGPHVFGVEFTKEGMDENSMPTGTMKLYVDDKHVADSPMRTLLIQYTLCGEGLCVGYDGGDAVSQLYEGSQFPFTGGEIAKVVFDLADDQYLDVERQMASLLARD